LRKRWLLHRDARDPQARAHGLALLQPAQPDRQPPQWQLRDLFATGSGSTSAPVSAPTPVTHTPSASGNILVYNPVRFNYGDTSGGTFSALDDQVPQDIAIVVLDQLVPYTVAVPLHPQVLPGDPECGDSFTGAIVGYGNGNVVLGCAPTPPPAFVGQRRFNTFGWSRDTQDNGSYFYADFDDECSEYQGQSNGGRRPAGC